MIFPSLWINHMYIYVYVYHIKTPHDHPQLPDAKSGCRSKSSSRIKAAGSWCLGQLTMKLGDLKQTRLHFSMMCALFGFIGYTYAYTYIYSISHIYICIHIHISVRVCVCVFVQLYMCAYVRMLKILKPSMY